ncbi:MAG TPA: Ada metal-binding domain-containing protein [Candidatus Elarobacter sp.]|jgi:methylphosphotriester-DNA--protein-cysteine methyltransferase
MTDDERYDRIIARDRQYDGEFFTAVVTTGIYCVPSCAGRKPYRQNVQFFTTQDDAKAAGFRPCLRCRPDRLGVDDPELLVRAAREAFARAPAEIRTVADLARATGRTPSALTRALHARDGISVSAWLRRERARWCSDRLRATSNRTIDVAFEAGYGSEASFYREFKRHYAVAPSFHRSAHVDGAPRAPTLRVGRQRRGDDRVPRS